MATIAASSPGRFWPSSRQEQLLVAALAMGAGQAAPRLDDIEDLEPGTFDLLPLLYRRHPSLERLKGVYRREWVKAALLAERTAAIAAALEQAGMRGLFLGGAPLAGAYYPEPGLRPSWYVDILVDGPELDRAAAALGSEGWAAQPSSTGARRVLADPGSTVCIVRSRVTDDFASNESLWEGAQGIEVAGRTVEAPAPADALLVACVAGARRQPLPSLLWILDAVMVIRSGAVDWERLVTVGESSGQALRLRHALAYLERLPGVGVPEPAARGLAACKARARDRLAFTLASGSVQVGGSLPELAASHLATSRGRTLAGTMAGFPGYLATRWELPRRRDVLPAAARKAGRRLRRR